MISWEISASKRTWMFGEQRPKDACLSLRGCGWHLDALTSQKDCAWGDICESLLSLSFWLTQAFQESMTEVGRQLTKATLAVAGAGWTCLEEFPASFGAWAPSRSSRLEDPHFRVTKMIFSNLSVILSKLFQMFERGGK